jgi:hypothetical protein
LVELEFSRRGVDLIEQNELDISGQPLMSHERRWRWRFQSVRDSTAGRPIRDRDVPSPEEMVAILDLIDLNLKATDPGRVKFQ